MKNSYSTEEGLQYIKDRYVFNDTTGDVIEKSTGKIAGRHPVPISDRLYIRVGKKEAPSSIIAWALIYGEWPSNRIGFRNGKCSDTRKCNMYITYSSEKSKRSQEYNRLTEDQRKDRALRQSFGISLEDFNKLNKDQEFVCAICGKEEDKYRKGKKLPLHVDHDHSTNIVRGLLCSWCNLLLGHAKDDKNILVNAVRYLEAHEELVANGGDTLLKVGSYRDSTQRDKKRELMLNPLPIKNNT